MNANFFSPLIEQALRIAACCHQSQCRKGGEIPYVTHPVSVMLILQQAGFHDEELLAAALLHDVVEDTSFTIEEIKHQLTSNVAKYVAGMTEQKKNPDGSKRKWKERKEGHINSMANEPIEVRAIELADKLHNLSTICFDLDAGDVNVWERFHAAPNDIIWYYRSMVQTALGNDEQLEPLANACLTQIDKLESSLQSNSFQE